MFGAEPIIIQRLQLLERHLEDENPILIEAVNSFRELDKIAYRMGMLRRDQSFATLIPWWPLVSVLGTFSAGKSTFINDYIGMKLQVSGNQAVDDKFTVMCHSKEQQVHTLPGLALDADPRFPFYQISEEIEKVSDGEGKRIDSYIQLKTCPSEVLRGKILIDSPGFDADDQRTATLKLTEHIIDLSDLVLVFFDARHPEPGAMQDTLNHLVSGTIHRADSSKFLFILNQIDTAAREDNPEEVFGAWQRALAQKGLTAGRFYTIYNEKAAMPIEDEALRQRFSSKRDHDLADIHSRIKQVEIERAYRIVGALEKLARNFEQRLLPLMSEALQRWRKLTLIGDGLLLALLLGLGFYTTVDTQQGEMALAPWVSSLSSQPLWGGVSVALLAFIILYLHYVVRNWARKPVLKWLAQQANNDNDKEQLRGVFMRSSASWRSVFQKIPCGWGRGVKRRLDTIISDTDRYVQMLNDRYANPSGVHSAMPSESRSQEPNSD
ncbi:dynamin family protein [Ectothiorhodospiraceae bacterium BW-2]|nr:dynamin family protein [Ectothiorhodospiraceae bacterium BW-2]